LVFLVFPRFTLNLYLYEPPYAERHVRWRERTVSEIITHFLLDYTALGDTPLPGKNFKCPVDFVNKL